MGPATWKGENMKRKLMVAISDVTLIFALALPSHLAAQEQEGEMAITSTENPVPLINQPLVPDATRPGGAGFSLTVNGTGFVSGSVVKWNGSTRATTVVGRSQLKATIFSTDIAKAGTAWVKVANPSPGGGTSNLVFFEITRPTSSVALSASSVHAGSNPTSAAVGDFNGDGKLDLAVANAGSKNVSVLLGNGDGTFKAPVNFGAPGSQSVAVGDFNGDGKLDLVVTNAGVSILLGNGDGAFRAPVTYATGNSPSSVAVGDFNRDGKVDLAVANSGTSNGVASVSVLLGRGDGTFNPAVNYSGGFGSLSLAVGDFNRDGKLDLVEANFSTGNVTILLGNGNGTFQPALEFVGAGSPNPSSLAVGDFIGHGRLDVAVADGSTVATLLQPPLVSGVNAFLPASLMFGTTQLVGTISPVQPVLLVNYGTLTLSITSISTNGDFIQSHTCGSSLGAGSSCTIYVAFKPSLGGARTGILSVTDDAPGSPQTVSLTGMGTVVELARTSLSFGCYFACHLILGCHCYCSGSKTTTLTNVGRTALNITDVMISGPFSLGNACPANLGAGQSCGLTVGWQRVSGNGEISISDNGGASPQTVFLSGTKQCSP